MKANFTDDEYDTFSRRYPGALAYITSCNLLHEYEDLKRELERDYWVHPGRKTWVLNRLEELKPLEISSVKLAVERKRR